MLNQITLLVRKGILLIGALCCFSFSWAVNPAQVARYAGLGQVWGFLKYYHPQVAKGNLNWDQVLLEILEADVFWQNESSYHQALTQLTTAAGTVRKFRKAKWPQGAQEGRNVDWAWMEDPERVPPEIKEYLQQVKTFHRFKKNAYILDGQRGYRLYQMDQSYAELTAPPQGMGMLALFQYWNVIHYFYPYKDLESTPWELTLYTFIPKFLQVKTTEAYYQTLLQLTKRIKDSHADFSQSPIDLTLFGSILFPFRMVAMPDTSIWIGTLLVDSLAHLHDFRPGDQVLSIDGVSVANRISQLSPYIAASNKSVYLRYLCSYLGFGAEATAQIEVLREGTSRTLTVPRLTRAEIYQNKGFTMGSPPMLEFLDKEQKYLYLNMGRVQRVALDTVLQQVSKTEGVIIDLRHGVNLRGDEIAEALAYGKLPYTVPHVPDFAYPGYLTISDTLYLTGARTAPYPGKIVLLVNEGVQSISEISTMLFQAIPQTVVMGQQTAGTVSTISRIALPGRFQAVFTNVCLTYPDGKMVQGEGVSIDMMIERTQTSIRSQEDETLRAAKQFLQKPSSGAKQN